MARAPDSPDSRAPDSWLRGAWAPDSGAAGLSLGRAIQLFLAAKGAEGASPKTIEWYRAVRYPRRHRGRQRDAAASAFTEAKRACGTSSTYWRYATMPRR